MLVFAAMASGAVDGTVTNRTTGKPQPGATVTLYRLSQQAGLDSVESVKSGPDGKFLINQEIQGPRLLQTAYDGVTYNHMLPPGSRTSGVALEVYDAINRPGDATVTLHIMLFEPSGAEMAVRENFVWENSGKTTFNDPDRGTLRFHVPEGAKDLIVNCTAPQGMPIRRAAEPAGEPNVYKLDFPIKPGETSILVEYTLPFSSPGTFSSKAFYPGSTPTAFVAPPGVTIKGDGVESKRIEPRTQSTILETARTSYTLTIEGSGVLKRPQAEPEESSGPAITFVLPKLYERMWWILGLSGSILVLGFVLLYRAGQTAPSPKGSGKKK
jgi:hypothetical protein